jgi:hypothetical protein
MALTMPNGYKICNIVPFQGFQKCFNNWTFGVKINHLATLLGSLFFARNTKVLFSRGVAGGGLHSG